MLTRDMQHSGQQQGSEIKQGYPLEVLAAFRCRDQKVVAGVLGHRLHAAFLQLACNASSHTGTRLGESACLSLQTTLGLLE